MKEIIAYEMLFKGVLKGNNDFSCIPFQRKYWDEYMGIYNECFYEMRKDLEIEPVNFYSDYSQMQDKACGTFLYLHNGAIAGVWWNCFTCSRLEQKCSENVFKGRVYYTERRKGALIPMYGRLSGLEEKWVKKV